MIKLRYIIYITNKFIDMIKTKVLRSWYLLSADYEMFNQTDYVYGFAFPHEIEVISVYNPKDGAPVGFSVTLDKLIEGYHGHKVKEEEIQLPTQEYEQDPYEERVYALDKDIPLEDMTFFYFINGNGDKMYLYDIVKYQDKYYKLYSDE